MNKNPKVLLSKGHGGSRPGAGPPKKKFDLDKVENLSALQATDEELGWQFGVNPRTIQRHKQDNPEFIEAMEKGKAKGRISLRRLIMQSAANGNIAAQIFLCKTVLGMREQVEVIERPSAVKYGWVKAKKPADTERHEPVVEAAPEETGLNEKIQ